MMPYFADTDYMWGGFALPFANGQYAVGVSMGRFGFSDQPVYTAADPTGESGLTYGVSESYVGLSFAHAFIDRFTGGVTVKYISDELGATRASSFAVDIGTNFHTEVGGKPISMAVSIRNLGGTLRHQGRGLNVDAFPVPDEQGTPVTAVDPSTSQFQAHGFEIPVNFNVSLAYDVVSSAANRVTALGSFTERNTAFPSFGFGGEYQWSPPESPVSASLRGSYTAQMDNSFTAEEEAAFDGMTEASKVGLDGLVVGGGVALNIMDYQARIDYAYRHFGVLGSVNVFTIGLAWD